MPNDIQPNNQDIVGNGSPLPAIGIATIDAPERTDEGYGNHLKLEARSVKTVDHAWNICKATEQNNRTRAARTADIQSLHDGEPPRSSASQAERGKSWQSNASTNWLSGIVGRVSQRFVGAVISQIYVTSSSLSSNLNNSKAKTDLLRAKFTQLVRSWDGNTGMINSLAVETALQGYAYAVFLDPYTYKPTMFKQDRAFCPEQSGQHARDLQFFVGKMDYRLDEFLALFKDEEAAKEVGYDLDNCVYAANNAKMMDPREDATTTQFRKFVEMINEGVLGLTFTSTGARVVSCWLLFNQEYDGKVSFWLIHRDSGKMLRFSFKIFPKMEDAIALFSFEPGNGCIHSAKGLGRKLASLTIMKELFRNGIIDNSRMSGLMILRADAKDKSKFAPAVMAPFIVIDKSVEIPEQQFVANGESYRATDLQIDGWAEQSVGAYLAAQIAPEGRTEKTATEANIDSRRESEAADIMIRRWIDQFANLTQIQQLRAFSDDYISEARRMSVKLMEDPTRDKPGFYEGRDNSDSDALRALVEVMMDPLQITDDEIKIWRSSPASQLAHTADAAVAQGVSVVMQKYAGNPNVDQPKLIQRDIENIVGAELAQEFFIPTADQTVVAEAKRQQLIESNAMMAAQLDIPVSPRDNHFIHAQTVQELLTTYAAPILSKPNPPPEILKAVELNLNHLLAHLKIGDSMGLNKNPQFRDIEKFALGFKKQLAQVIQINAHMEASQNAVMDTIRREGLPPDEAGAASETPPDQSLGAAQPGSAMPQSISAPPQGEAPALANVPS